MTPEQLNVFLTYTERYDRVFSELPACFRSNGEFAEADLKTSHEQAAIRFFNLCAEEFYLADEKMIQSDVWTAWKTQIAKAVKHWFFNEMWPKVRPDFLAGNESFKIYDGFIEFMDKEVSKN